MSKVIDRASAVFKTNAAPAGEKLAAAVAAEHARHEQVLDAEQAQYANALSGIVDAAQVRQGEIANAQLALAREQAALETVVTSANSAL